MVVGDLALERETIVIGSGPGGYVAAIRAAQLGQQVSIIERDKIGGVCLNEGCIPSKALINVGHRYQTMLDSAKFGLTSEQVKLDFKQTQQWKNNRVVKKLTKGVEDLLKKNQVEIIQGSAFFNDAQQLRVIQADQSQSYVFKNAIIATGSRPIEIPGFKFSNRVLDSSGALGLSEIPAKIIFIGGGYIGSELAGIYANLGSQVTIVEALPNILATFDFELVEPVLKGFKQKKVQVLTSSLAQSVKETANGIVVTIKTPTEELDLSADYVVVTVGRRPNTDDLGLELAGVELNERGLIKIDQQGKTSQPHIYAIGDVVAGPALAHKASYEAKIVAEVIAGKQARIDYQALPAVCFTDPEIASTGLTPTMAQASNLEVEVAKFPLAGNGRALSLDATEGFVQLVSLKESGILVGAQVVGVSASEIIAELTLAIETQTSLADIALVIHAHPTVAEAIMDTAELGRGLPIHY